MIFSFLQLNYVYLSFTVAVNSQCLNSVSECAANGVGQYPQCSDCNKFIKCFGSSGNLFTCPSGLNYDVNLGVCQYPGLAVCGYDMADRGIMEIDALFKRHHRKCSYYAAPPFTLSPSSSPLLLLF